MWALRQKVAARRFAAHPPNGAKRLEISVLWPGVIRDRDEVSVGSTKISITEWLFGGWVPFTENGFKEGPPAEPAAGASGSGGAR